MFKKISIIGLGLLGSSVGHAVKKYTDIHVYGYDLSADVGKKTLDLGCVDNIGEIDNIISDSDCVLLCTPLGTFSDLARKIIPYMKQGAVLTDTGSVKGAVIKNIRPFLRDDINFIPAHPVAGTEKSGPESGFADLFKNRQVIFTPIGHHNEDSISYLKKFWENLGATTETMDVEHHDLVFAVVSHIPHLIAYNIVGTAAHLEQVSENEVISYSASGFQDFTRLASSNPIIWRDVFIQNKEAVIEMLGRFTEDLFDLQKAIRYEDAKYLEDFFEKAKEIREKVINNKK